MNRESLRRMWNLLTARERRRALGIVLLMVIGGLAEAVGIGLVFPFISLLANPGLVDAALLRDAMAWLGIASLERLALVAALGLIAVFIAKNLFLALLFVTQARFVAAVEARLAAWLLQGYLRAPYLARLERSAADRMRIITGEVNRAAVGYLMSLLNLMTEVMVVIALVILLLIVQPLLTLAVVVVVGGTALLLQVLSRPYLNRLSEKRVKATEQMYRWISQGLGAFKEIKVLGREAYFLEHFSRGTDAYAHASGTFAYLNLMPRLVVELVAVVTLLGAVAISIAAGRPMQELVPVLTLFGLAAVRLMPSATRMVGSAHLLRYHGPAVHAVAQDLEAPAAQATDAPGRGSRPEPVRSLELRGASFSFPGLDSPTLKDISIEFRQGELVGIVGRSGSGKTTLADLLLGLISPSRGEMLVNGRVVRSFTGEWGGIAGLVSQNFFILDDSIRRNVAFGLDDARIDEGRVWHALELAQLAERVRGLPGGLDNLVGDQGATLSGGERQRLSIARAMYDDPDILVLDEATSALDPATEAEFIAALKALKGQKTVILITHRIASTAWCDKVLVMEAGRIVAAGPYLELQAGAAAFAALRGAEQS
jgi:ABC-type multidrug transport system fused ATPase/permease subunit